MAKKPKCGSKSLRIIPAAFSTNYSGVKQAVWDGNPPRYPLRGELYMSGASGYECAYEAPADMGSPYFIAVPKPAAEPEPLSQRLADVANEATAAGYVITYWNPEEIGIADPETLIDAVVQRGNDYLAEANGWPDPEEE